MNTKLLKQKILDLAIRGKLVPQDPNDEPASELLKRIRAEKEKLIAEGKIKRSKKAGDKPHYKYENAPFEIPESWEWTTIESVCSKIGSGSTPRGGNYTLTGIPFFRSQNIYNDGLVYDDIKYISQDIHQQMISTEVLPNDVLLNITGGSLGRCAIVPLDFIRGNVSQHVCILRPVTIDSKYLHCFILSSHFFRTMKVTGSGREGLPKYNLEKMLIPLPPIEEQKRIVYEIGKWHSLIDNLISCSAELDELIKQTKSKILGLAIHGKLVSQDPNDEPATELLKRIAPHAVPCDTSHYEYVPESWCIVRLGDIYNHTTGKALKKSNTNGVLRKYITTSNLYWNSFDLTVVRSMCFTNEELEKCTVHKGDLLLCNGGDVGRAAIWNYDEDICIQNHISRLRPKFENTVDNLFYYYVLMYLKQNGLLNGKGVAITSLSAADLLSIQVPLPPKNEQVKIVQTIQEIENSINKIISNI